MRFDAAPLLSATPLCRRQIVAGALCLIAWLAVSPQAAGDIVYDIRGVEDPIKANILSHIDVLQIGAEVRVSDRDFERLVANTIAKAHQALRPFGYYSAKVTGDIRRNADGQPVMILNVERGEPIIIESLEIDIVGPGADSSFLRNWRRNWPLSKGDVLNQVVWEEQKRLALEVTDSRGYLNAKFSEQALDIDLDRKKAAARLTLDTGPRFVMGDIDFGEHILKPGILESIPRFDPGDPYTMRLMERFREDLWQTGYFTDIDVIENEVTDVEPPRVDLTVRTRTDYRNRYTGAIGFGNDTGYRVQANWSRHPVSPRGDRLDLGIGWQERDDEVAVRATYRLPRRDRRREFWVIDTQFRFENMDLEFKIDPEDEGFVKFANGDITERHIRLGRLKLYNLKGGEAQLQVTPFLQYINSERNFKPIEPVTEESRDEGLDQLLKGIDNAYSIGVEAGIISILGRGWETRGRRDRGWVFHSDKAFGSEVEFTQFYLSTRRSYLMGDRWKFIVRGEVGYTDALVDEFSIDLGDNQLELSRTRLPNFYRFKAGGSQSVRGYGFETLSNNDVGSNHIITASAEIEFKVLERWSGAAFVDIGNAFNDWNKPELKTGIGVGIRWYSIAGPIRIDVAQAQDHNGKPWRWHFTIGVPLL